MRKHPLIAFFVLAYLLTWWIYPLLRFSPLLGIAGLFGPALAAIIMAAVTGGKSGVKALLNRVVLWRVGHALVCDRARIADGSCPCRRWSALPRRGIATRPDGSGIGPRFRRLRTGSG